MNKVSFCLWVEEGLPLERNKKRGRKPTVRTAPMSRPLTREERANKQENVPLEDLEEVEWEREENLEIGSRQDQEHPQTTTHLDWQYPGEVTPEGKTQLIGKVMEVAVKTKF